MNINDLDRSQFDEIVSFETDEKIKEMAIEFRVQKPLKITLDVLMTSTYNDGSGDDKKHESELNLNFEYKEFSLNENHQEAPYALKLCGHALMKSDLQQIYNTFIFDLVKKLDAYRKAYIKYLDTKRKQEEKIQKEQLEIFKKISKDNVMPKTILLDVTYTSSLASFDSKDPEKTISLPVEIGYTFGYGFYIKKDQLFYFSDLYAIIQKWDLIQKQLISNESMNNFWTVHYGNLEQKVNNKILSFKGN